MQGLHVPQSQVYDRNVGILKQYTSDLFKLIHMYTLRKPGFEDAGDKGKKNTAGNVCKLSQSLSRTKAKIYELAICNPWDFFVTGTFSPDEHDRHDLGVFKQLSKWINNLNTRQGIAIKCLIIPEQHKDGAWHFHGLFSGIPESQLVRNEHGYLDWLPYREKFGWISLDPLRDATACAKYMTKYITKELQNTRIALNDHMYYASKGLKRADVVFKAKILQSFTADYENEYCKVKQFSNQSDAMTAFTDQPGVETEQNQLFCLSCDGAGVSCGLETTEQNTPDFVAVTASTNTTEEPDETQPETIAREASQETDNRIPDTRQMKPYRHEKAAWMARILAQVSGGERHGRNPCGSPCAPPACPA